MELIAFPVKKGDSFLLINEEFNLLVDGGNGRTDIIPHIVKHTDMLNVVICTHYDTDHINGLLNLFEMIISNNTEISVEEIWLPEIFERIALKKRQDACGIRVSLRKEEINVVHDDGTEDKLSKEHIDTGIKNICRLTDYCHILSVIYGVKIRWFKFTDELSDMLIDHRLYGMNCEEVTRRIKPYGSYKEIIYHLTRINKDSLVFRYNQVGGEEPNVLFTADSDFGFCGGKIVEFNSGKTVVTTPHHGSSAEEHKKVYLNLNLKSRDFIFVRSSEFYRERPCEGFKEHPKEKRYCIRCNSKRDISQTIHLRFMDGKWNPVNSETCTC